jgi:hypothetical protein
MRLALKVNGTSRAIAAVNGPGYLSAHLNMHDRPKENDNSKTLQISGIQTLETETMYFDWPKLDMQIGDAVEIRLLDDGEGDAPGAVRRSSESPRNLFSRPELANELLTLTSDFESRLMELVGKSERTESAEEHKRFTTAVGRVLSELGDSFLYPVYRRHKELVPDELKGELL